MIGKVGYTWIRLETSFQLETVMHFILDYCAVSSKKLYMDKIRLYTLILL